MREGTQKSPVTGQGAPVPGRSLASDHQSATNVARSAGSSRSRWRRWPVAAAVVCAAALASTALGVVSTASAATYKENYRPQVHFSPEENWMNDPNGMVYYKGQYHLFFQHNPSGITQDNLSWGHAVSSDLVHWKQLPLAISQTAVGRRPAWHPWSSRKRTLRMAVGCYRDQIRKPKSGDHELVSITAASLVEAPPSPTWPSPSHCSAGAMW